MFQTTPKPEQTTRAAAHKLRLASFSVFLAAEYYRHAQHGCATMK
jgi:hypothetical protein